MLQTPVVDFFQPATYYIQVSRRAIYLQPQAIVGKKVFYGQKVSCMPYLNWKDDKPDSIAAVRLIPIWHTPALHIRAIEFVITAEITQAPLVKSSNNTMYPSPLPEIQGPEKYLSDAGQFLYSTTTSPQPTLQVPSPQVVQVPQNVQQSFAADAAIGLHYQMSSELSNPPTRSSEMNIHFVKCTPNVPAAIIKSSESMVHVE